MTEKNEYTFSVKLIYPRPFYFNEKYNKYTLQCVVTDEVRRAIKATGIRSNAKEDDTWGWFYTLGSKQPISVEDANGNEWDKSVLIGNGTEATIKLLVEKFDTKPRGEPGTPTYYAGGMVTRGTLTRVRIDKLVPYEKPQEGASTAESPKPAPAAPAVPKGEMPF